MTDQPTVAEQRLKIVFFLVLDRAADLDIIMGVDGFTESEVESLLSPSSVSHRERSDASNIRRTASSMAIESKAFLTILSEPTILVAVGFFCLR